MAKSKLTHRILVAQFIFLATQLLALNSWAGVVEASQKKSIEMLSAQNYKPISYVESGKLVGLSADIIKAINQRLTHFHVELVAIDWKEGLKKIKGGESSAIMGTFNTGKLRPWMYPYSDAIYPELVVVICGTDVKLEQPIIWPDSFKNKLMLNIAGFDGWLNNQVRNRRFTRLMNFLEVPNVNIAADMVDKNNADCSLFESNVFNTINNERGANNPLKADIVATVQNSYVHVGYSFKAWKEPANSYLADFAREFDFALVELKLDGELDKILAQHNRKVR